ncbi:MAG: low specificity L-threonine aldolase [Lachnospiraceae bacterium]|nr:low specificity L-threonine aldolase [Lachnospiraceae bacterium]
MLSFESDYVEGAHEQILRRLAETNLEQLSGYGCDPYCESAKKKIREACGCPGADIYFLVGGTQTNLTVIDGLLAPYEGVIAAESGHVSVHEAGAIEYTGHKVLTLPQHQGKIHADELETYLRTFWEDENHEHMVYPGMVYISHPTEYGTLYSRAELENLSAICEAHQIPLYMDGARLGYGLMSRQTDVTLFDVARCCHAFYIGGTKVGALCGEAVVFPRRSAPKHFLTIIKQHGALLAKGRLLGIQFDALFTDDLYFKISRHAIDMAEFLKKGLRECGIHFHLESPTNQQFVLFGDEDLDRLKKHAALSFWEKPDEDHTIVRLATSWATKEADILTFIKILKEIL